MIPIKKRPELVTRRQMLRLLGIGVGSMFVSPLLTGCAVDPVTGRQQFMVMSEADEIAVDRQQSPYQFSSDYGPVQDQRLNDYISRVGMELASRSHRPQMPFSFRAVNAAYINAYAFPGGSIAATRGILVELKNEAELAGLLGHEIGHVCARHTAEQAGKSTLANLLMAGASIATSAAGYGAAADLVQGLGGLSAGALLAHYSRDNEREADALGMEYMNRTGYTPEGMVGLMEILQENGRNRPGAVELMFATHPMSEERYQTARNAAQSTYRDMLSGSDNRERYMDNTAGLRRIKDAISGLQRANGLLNKKKYEQARQELASALKIAPNDYAALVMMSKCRFALKHTAEAERYALKASKVYPQEAQAHVITGVTSIMQKKYGQAYQQFTEYDKLLPGNPEITFFKGYSLEGMQRREESAGEYSSYLRKVNRGEKAQHAYNRLKTWGYVR